MENNEKAEIKISGDRANTLKQNLPVHDVRIRHDLQPMKVFSSCLCVLFHLPAFSSESTDLMTESHPPKKPYRMF
jgi:hypothetical protein